MTPLDSIDISDIAYEIKENGYVKLEHAVSSKEISKIKEEVDLFLSGYSEDAVKKRIFYPRESGKNRQGDAFMVSVDLNPDLPSYDVSGGDNSSKLLELQYFYNDVVSELTGNGVSSNSRSMLNVQQYFEKSFEVADHYDMEAFDYEHGHDDEHNERTLILNKALIPRYVMVVVLSNENDGVGTYVRQHDSTERIPVENHAGDVIIFDNVRFRHGVPVLEKPRMMIGFRNFDHLPMLFESEPDGGNTWIEVNDKINPGWVREISNEEAKEIMVEFNKKWSSELYEEMKDKEPAF